MGTIPGFTHENGRAARRRIALDLPPEDAFDPGSPAADAAMCLANPPQYAKSTNPKKAMGMAKPPLHLIPGTALVHMAMSFKDGAAKYGPFNWRDDPVDVTTYIAAAKRHIDLYFNGQRLTSDSKVHNLGAVMACMAILLDAEACGTLIDDRPKAVDLEAIMAEFTTA